MSRVLNPRSKTSETAFSILCAAFSSFSPYLKSIAADSKAAKGFTVSCNPQCVENVYIHRSGFHIQHHIYYIYVYEDCEATFPQCLGADPCTGSKIPGSCNRSAYEKSNILLSRKKQDLNHTESPRAADGSNPTLPGIMAARSERISPNMTPVKMVSN